MLRYSIEGGFVLKYLKIGSEGIPCKHAIGAIYIYKREPEDLVHSSYHIGTFIRTYSNIIKPIPDQDLWVQTNYELIMPSPLRTQSGRPKKMMKAAGNLVITKEHVKHLRPL